MVGTGCVGRKLVAHRSGIWPALPFAVGVGIANTRERLRARYGDRASFTLDIGPDGNGSSAEIRLPILA